MAASELRGLRSGRNINRQRQRRDQFIEESREECNCCCDCCNFRCWGIFLLIWKILANIGLIIFGGWALHSWELGQGFGAVVLIVSIISFMIHILGLYGVVHGITNFIFLSLIFEVLKIFFDIIYGICLGVMVTARYFGSAVFFVIWDAFVIWVLYRVYQTAKRVQG